MSTIDSPFQYSGLVPNNKVAINGNIFGDYVEKTTISYSEMAISPSTCQPVAQQLFVAATSRSDLQKSAISNPIKVVDLGDSYLPYGVLAKNPTQTTQPIVYGAQIITANVIGAIHVRAKTGLNNLCSVKLQTESGIVNLNLNLIPNSWSEWVAIDNHVGSVVKSITSEDSCGGNIVSEVRYFE